MREFQSKVNLLLKDHKKHKRYLAFLLALSMIVSVAVPFSLIMPAVSMTLQDIQMENMGAEIPQGAINVGEVSDGNNYFNVALTDANGNELYRNWTAMNAEGNLKNEFYENKGYSVVGSSVGLSFILEYFKKEVGNSLSDSGPHLYMDITGLVGTDTTFVLQDGAKTGDVTDGDYYNAKGTPKAGTYEITDEGLILITLTPEYIAYVQEGGGDLKGTLSFSGTLGRSEDEDGNRQFNVGGYPIEVDFKDQYPTVTKQNTINSSTGKVEWTLAIDNSGKVDLRQYELSDYMLSSAQSVTITPDSVGSWNGSSIVFTEAAKNEEYIIVTYDTEITPDQLKNGMVENTVTLKKPGTEYSQESSSKATFDKTPVTVNKNGTQDYSSGKYEGKINWTIDLSSAYGTSLKDYILEDVKIPDDYTSTPSNALVSMGNGKWKLNTDESRVTIRYAAPATAGENNVNTATILYPGGTDKITEDTKSVEYKKESDLLDFEKNGNYDQNSHEITWTITVKPIGTTLNGYTLTDAQFPASLDDFTFRDSWIKDKVELNGSALKFKDDCNIQQNVTFTYKTKVTDVNGEAEVTNPIEDNKGHKYTPKVTVTFRNTLDKALNTANDTNVASSGAYTKDLDWTVNIVRDDSFQGMQYTDVLNAPDGTTTHTISAEQLAAMKVYGGKSEWNLAELQEGTDYTVTPNGNGGFTVTFNESLDTQGYNYVRMNYHTTATASPVTAESEYKEYTFTNGGTFAGNSDSEGFTFGRVNPAKYESMTLGITKNWNGDGASLTDRPNTITVGIKYKTNTDSTWRNVRVDANGNYLFKGDAGYDSASNLEVDLSGDWQTTIQNLPKEIAKPLADGTRGPSTYYTYQVEEIKQNGQTVQNGFFETANGLYEIGYENNSLSNDGTIKINNTYHSFISLTPVKSWQGTEGSGTGITSVKVRLECVLNNKVYYPVQENGKWVFKTSTADATVVTLQKGQNWSGAPWTGLPYQTAIGNTTYICRYRITEIQYNDTAINGDQFMTDDGYYSIGSMSTNTSGSVVVTNTYQKKIDLIPEKKWQDKNNQIIQDVTNVNNITVELQRQTNNNGQWETVAEATLTKANNWQISEADATPWKNLDVKTIVDGKTVDYSYRVVETKYDGNPINGNQFTVSDGYYTKQDSNTTQTDGTLAVANTFTKTENQRITTEKEWVNDTEYLNNRPTEIYAQLWQSSENGQWVEYGDPVALTANNGWKCEWKDLPNQEIKDGTVTTFKYKVTECSYTFDGTTIAITGDKFATTTDGTYKIGSNNCGDTWNGISIQDNVGTTKLTNTFTPVGSMDIVPQKQWMTEGDFAGTNRPTSVTLRVQKKNSSGEWENVQKPDGSYYDVEINAVNSETDWSGNAIWTGATITGLPTMDIWFDADGTYHEADCAYRLTEVGYTFKGSYTELESGATLFATTQDGSYIITPSQSLSYSGGTAIVTNAFDEVAGATKTILGKNGDRITSIEKDELSDYKFRFEADGTPLHPGDAKYDTGEEYYVFNWVIELNSSRLDLVAPIKDTLPEGFTLVEEPNTATRDYTINSVNIGSWGNLHNITDPFNPDYTDANSENYYLSPCIMWLDAGGQQYAKRTSSQSEAWHDGSQTSPATYYYDKTSGEVYFGIPSISEVPVYTYSTKIKCEDLDKKLEKGTYNIVNTIELCEKDSTILNGSPNEVTLKINNPVPTDLITKSYSKEIGDSLPGYMEFSLDINPEGKNLSNGDTIDIQDLFKTSSYYDAVNNTIEYGENLVDVLMTRITLYEVDANGDYIELLPNQYMLLFSNGESLAEGAALAQFSIPDEKHIVINYTYKLIANENTPSVKNGRKSTIAQNGRYPVMQPGMVPPAGDIVTFSNRAELTSDSASGSSTVGSTEYEISESRSTIMTNTLPKIKKVNTGDYTINSLQATFLLAKYENGQWFYASDVNERSHKVEWFTEGISGDGVSEGAVEIEVQTAYQVSLNDGTLYKLVEVSVPNGYEGSNLRLTAAEYKTLVVEFLNHGTTEMNGRDYGAYLRCCIHPHYFVYNSTVSSLPEGLSASDVMQIMSGGDVEIPNNELIDLGVSKEWINPIENTDDSEITVELYWSYTKAVSGIPEDALLADAETLGLIDPDFRAEKTIKVSEKNDKVWTDLPNGKNNQPIYYYVKETAYTIGNVTYTLDEEANTYVSESGTAGIYQPTYVGNATNTDSSVKVRNSYQLMLKKEWKNSANDPLKAIPVNKITISIYGMDEDGVKTEEPILTDVQLEADSDWTTDITDLVKDIDLSQYRSFVAEEVGTSLEGFVVSCVFNLNAQTGEIIVTNKNTQATEASVSVKKLWSDGNELHEAHEDSVTVRLYQSIKKIPDLSKLRLFLNAAIVKGSAKPVEIAGSEEDETEEAVIQLSAENEWQYTWTGLPLENEQGDPYYYYVLEDILSDSDITDGSKYAASYAISSSTATKTEYTVTNTRRAIVLQKQWIGENGQLLSDEELAENKIVLSLYKKSTEIPQDGLKLIAFGDSITDGYEECSKNGKDYPSKLINLLKSNYTITNTSNVYDFNKGQSQQQIGGSSYEGFRGRVATDIPSDTNIVCFVGGTNDIHQGGSSVKGDPQGVYERFVACIEAIQQQASDAVIFVGSIPHFDFYKDNNPTTVTQGGSWWSWLTGYADNDGKIPNDLIDQYNAKIESYANKPNDNVYFVDVCSVVTDDYIRADGCHPNENGYTAIAEAFAEAINGYYTTNEKVAEVTLNKDNGWMAAYDVPEEDTDTIYYVVEETVPYGWEVSYSNNEQKPGTGVPITAINTRDIAKTELSVQKTWKNDDPSDPQRDLISIALLQRTADTDWIELNIAMPEPVKTQNAAGNDVWTYKYTDLPVEDTLGNRYWYTVEEDPLTGYTTSYGVNVTTGLRAVDDGDAGTLRITNTRAISLHLKKLWSDIDKNAHTGDKVVVHIYRSINPNAAPSDDNQIDLILQVPDKASVGVERNVTVAANKNVISAVSSDESIATVAVDGKNITITGVAGGRTTITVSDGTDSAEIAVSVSQMSLSLDKSSIVAGESATLAVENNEGNVSYTAVPEGIVSITGDTVTGLTDGKVTITATDAIGNTAQTDLTIELPKSFKLESSVEGGELKVGGELTLTPNPDYGTFEYSSSNEACATVDNNGKVTANGAGKAVITVTRKTWDGKKEGEQKYIVNVSAFQPISVKTDTVLDLPEDFNLVKSITVTIHVDSIPNPYYYAAAIKLCSEANTVGWGGETLQDLGVSVSGWSVGNSYIYTFDSWETTSGYLGFKADNVEYTVENIVYTYASRATLRFNAASTILARAAILPDGTSVQGELVQTVTLKNSDGTNWEAEIPDLDVYDSMGRAYYYWAVEDSESSAGYDISYLYLDDDSNTDYCINSGRLGANGGSITIRNTKQESTGVEMPSTGGRGVTWNYAAGAALMCSSAAIYLLFKRRKKKAS